MNRGFLPALALVIAAGTATLAWGTDGFRAYTSEGARRLALERAPRPVPDVGLIDQTGARFSLADYRGRVVLVEFIYTSCPTLCAALGDGMRRIEDALGHVGESGEVALVSISFDPARDRPPELARYAELHHAVEPGWRVAVPAGRDGLAALLRDFGVVVIPDRYGGFVHNGAIYLIDRRGRLARILDPAPAERLARQAMAAAAS